MKSFQEYRENVTIEDADGNTYAEVIDVIKPEPMKVPASPVKWKELTEIRRMPNYNKPGNILQIYLAWRGKTMSIQMFFPQVTKPSRKEVQDQIRKVYPGAKLWSYQISEYDPGSPLLQKAD